MESGLIGKLKQDSNYHDAGYWISDAIRLPLIPDTVIPVRFQGDSAERQLFDQTLANLLDAGESLRTEISKKLYQQWLDYNELVGLTDGLSVFREVEQPEPWHLDALANGEWLENLDEPGRVWEYLELETVVVLCADEGLMQVGLHFKCAWDEEHGVQAHLLNGNELMD